MKKIALILLTINALCIASCKKPYNGSNVCQDVFCTGVYAQILVTIHDVDRKDVSLFDFYTIRESTGDTLRLPQNLVGIPNGSPYPVLTDYYLDKFKNQSDYFRFIGIKDNKIVVDQKYFISADCCHVKKETGPKTIIIQ